MMEFPLVSICKQKTLCDQTFEVVFNPNNGRYAIGISGEYDSNMAVFDADTLYEIVLQLKDTIEEDF